MAYNVYFLCDECGDVGANYVNQTISYSRMEKIARERYGWHVSKDGKWVCPYCWERLHNGRKGKWEKGLRLTGATPAGTR